MGSTYVISGLRQKRARLAGEIRAAEKRLAKLRRELDTIDATINLFEPATDPELIPPVRPYTRCLYFEYSELTRLCLNALREAAKPMMGSLIADYAIAAKGLDVDRRVRGRIRRKVNTTLRRLERRGLVRGLLRAPDTWWEVAGAD